jgi:tRNA (guanine9-N1)-methyltransferase
LPASPPPLFTTTTTSTHPQQKTSTAFEPHAPLLTQEVDPSCYYIIGGLVDHNKETGLTHRLATQARLRTARLPIDEHMRVGNSHPLGYM